VQNSSRVRPSRGVVLQCSTTCRVYTTRAQIHCDYNRHTPTWRGNGIASRTFAMPDRLAMSRSMPSPKPVLPRHGRYRLLVLLQVQLGRARLRDTRHRGEDGGVGAG